VIDTAERRETAGVMVERKVSARRACWWLGLSRSWLKHESSRVKRDQALVERLMERSRTYPTYGSRMLCAKLRQEGVIANRKRVRRLCKLHGLLVKQRRRRKRRGIGAGMPCRAEYPDHVWAYDFVEDRAETGRKLRILTVIDEFTRRCVEVEVEHRMSARFVARTLLRLFARHGTPTFIRSDNGSEFIARDLMNVLKVHGVSARHIDPGSPWQNGIDERFNGTLRRELLDRETFHNRDHARALVKLYGRSYTNDRPHSSLGYQTPAAFYAKWKRENRGIAGHEASPHLGSAQTRDLPLCAPPAVEEKKDGPIEAEALPSQIDRPDSRMAILVTAPVASQQSRILCQDPRSVEENELAGKVSAHEKVKVAGSL
jgi:transposase InsO family protein